MALSVIILAAGQGTRMKSRLPKVLQPFGGATLLDSVIAEARDLGAADIHVVYGHGGEQVPEAMSHWDVAWVLQAEQLGTGHAVQQALPGIPDDHDVLILYGDVPLVPAETLRALVHESSQGRLAVLTALAADPHGYGRILRDEAGRVRAIVEHKDATEEQRAVREINTGLMACPAVCLKRWLARVGNDNAQGEYYLTDIIAMAAGEDLPVAGVQANCEDDVRGVNNRRQLAEAENVLRRRRVDALMDQGVTFRDPARADIRGEVHCGQDVVIDVDVILEGRVVIGDGVRIGPFTTVRDAEIGDASEILSHSVIEQALVGRNCRIGPYARLRPGAELVEEVHVGNFVEVKKSRLGRGSKANHLSYIGDADVGERVNIGAGTITCNYDGVNKHRTVIGNDAFIGSNTSLVAPVTVEDGATVGAGSTITRTVPAGQLGVSRARQVVIEDWQRPTRKKDD
ncbi:MAG: bifunctional UDP-N-acetylglucosamine diphosphorylase/glucosamine-1-phosphate N-acetyltransferase GlmU [Gammaproteobacteria bacterium]|jgi:bifunctional UDP-N-acetylglucosamine pyrophosphorylase/glucosamine-1-phosphate N-acetyltransferase